MKLNTLLGCTLLLWLSGCEGSMFGMPASQFKALQPAQQQQVINAYNQRELVRTQNEPLNSLIGVAGQAVNQLGHRNATPPATPTAPRNPSFPNINVPSFPNYPMPSIPHYNFKPEECHMEGNKQVCHHEERNIRIR